MGPCSVWHTDHGQHHGVTVHRMYSIARPYSSSFNSPPQRESCTTVEIGPREAERLIHDDCVTVGKL